MARVKFVVRGLVQGVCYRQSAREAAARLGLAGWVRNRADGSVEGEIDGDDGAVTAFVTWARRGPPAARVESVDTAPSAGAALRGFEVRR